MVLTSIVHSVSSYSCLQGSSKRYYDLDLWFWISIGIFLLSWWSVVPSCNIMKLSVQSVSWLQRFPTMWQYNLDLWPLILKNNTHLPLIMVINCTKLYDHGAYGSFCILPKPFSFYVTIRPWSLTSDLEKQ